MRARAHDKERCQPSPTDTHTHLHTFHTVNTAQRITQLQHILEILSPIRSAKEGHRDDSKAGAGAENALEADLRVLEDGEDNEQQRTDIDILVGDMNALTASDYTSEQWEVYSTSTPLPASSVRTVIRDPISDRQSTPASSIGVLHWRSHPLT